MGNKHISKSFGLRYYLNISYLDTKFTEYMDKATYWGIGGNVDFLWNFYNNREWIFGAFAGLGIGYQNISINGNLSAKTSGLDAWFQLGIRSVIYYHNGIEIGVKLPFWDTTTGNKSGSIGSQYYPESIQGAKRSLGFFVGYYFGF